MDSKKLFLTLDKEKPVTSMPIANVFSYDVEIHRPILNIGSILSIEAASSHILLILERVLIFFNQRHNLHQQLVDG